MFENTTIQYNRALIVAPWATVTLPRVPSYPPLNRDPEGLQWIFIKDTLRPATEFVH